MAHTSSIDCRSLGTAIAEVLMAIRLRAAI
jgi:hypothetical protein